MATWIRLARVERLGLPRPPPAEREVANGSPRPGLRSRKLDDLSCPNPPFVPRKERPGAQKALKARHPLTATDVIMILNLPDAEALGAGRDQPGRS
jgi:hypothetical protein